MTQEDYKLFTGAELPKLPTPTSWDRLVAVAKMRLASFLCLENGLPNPLPDDLKMVLANFIAGMIQAEIGNVEIESKHVRNFTINFRDKSAIDAFAGIANRYSDIIEMYSNCGSGFAIEKNARYCCDKGCACHE